MAVLDILVYPDPRLKQISKPVTQIDDSLRSFILDLEETLRAGPGGVGIAAPQVGRFERIVIVDVSCKPKIKHHGRLVLINPEILSQKGSAVGREGCLSVPEYTGNVARAKFVTLRAQDEFGQSHELQVERYEARAIQHEMDHLDGLLLLDRLVSRRDLFRRQTREAATPKSRTS
jgi:peptide deformylase